MPLPLQFRSALLLAASALAAPAMAQAPPMISGDPFMGGAYAVPTGTPIELSPGDPLASTAMMPSMGAPPMVAGNSVFMAPEIVGGGFPGGADCPSCNAGGTSIPGVMPYGTNMMAPSFGTPPMGAPMGAPMTAPMGPSMGPSMDMGVPLGGAGGAETIYPGYVDPTADIPAGAGFGGFGAPGVPPIGPSVPGTYYGAGGAQRCGWAFGFTFVFLKPHFGANDAFFLGSPTASGFNTTNHEFDYSLDLSPRLFLEWVAPNDLGFRTTWFSFDNGADTAQGAVSEAGFIRRPISPTQYPGGRITAGNDVSLNVLDFDLTQRLRVRRSLINIGGGLRWADYEHNYTSTISNPAYGSLVGNASRQFSGAGPTVFAEWRRPIGATRFSLLAKIRGSMLYGESETSAFERRPGGQSFSFNSENDDFVAVGETQLGGEWSAWIGPQTVLFVQAAFETQYWMGVGTAFDENDDLGLIGVNTTVGLEW